PATAATAAGKATAVAVAPAVVAGVSGGCGGIAVEKKGWCGDDGEVAVVVPWEVAAVGVVVVRQWWPPEVEGRMIE
nr:hypothetical protein [Tanacetum cinerariifolium]